MSAWDDATEAREEAGVSPFPHQPVSSNGGSEPSSNSALTAWIRDHQQQLRAGAVAKAHEYGSLDLAIMGGAISNLWPGIGEDAPPAAKLQAAIAFYLMGKVARVLSALAEGQPPPTDSWEDAEVYAMMGRYVQEHGQWP